MISLADTSSALQATAWFGKVVGTTGQAVWPGKTVGTEGQTAPIAYIRLTTIFNNQYLIFHITDPR